MKELSIEQKAKRYDEALERAKKLQETCDSTTVVGWSENIFPELKESEDERIRKSLIKAFGTIGKKNWGGLIVRDIVAWLEKQGEKPTDKVETKFKVGDWISGYYTNYKVTAIHSKGYVVEDTDGTKINILFENEKFHHLWTIQDAKKGDVLASGDVIFIFNNIHGVWVRCHCSLRKDGSFKDRNYDLMYAKDSKEVYPATKEQRDLLFEKMKEAGYEWDADKKELSKQTLQITPKFCVGQVITDDNGTWYKITNIKCLDDWYYVVYDVCEDITHHELCSIIDEKFRENRFAGEIKKMMGD